MRISVLDLSPVPPGGSAADAYANSVELARAAEGDGFHRYWVAEHHGVGAAVAATCPEVLITRVAGATTRIRVGAGTVLLNYSTPLRTAETYRGLHALFPDRVDLGIGRAEAAPVVDDALRPPRADPWRIDGAGDWGREAGAPGQAQLDALAASMAYEDQVTEVMAWLDGGFGPGDERSTVRLVRGPSAGPQPWLLGSSLASAMLAGRLGLRYGFAAFFQPDFAAAALRAYRACFTPSPLPSGVSEPHTLLAVNACCADTDRAADRLRATVELFYASASADRRLARADVAVAELGGIPAPSGPTGGRWPRHLSGSPDRLRDLLEQLVAETGADELMIQDLIADPSDRLQSYQLIARAFATAPALERGAPA